MRHLASRALSQEQMRLAQHSWGLNNQALALCTRLSCASMMLSRHVRAPACVIAKIGLSGFHVPA